MSATQTDPVVHGPSEETVRLRAEMQALEDLYPPPDDAEIKADFQWAYDFSWTLPNDSPYWNIGIAVYNRAIVGTGRDWMRLKIDLSKKFGVHPERIVVTVFGDPREDPA